MFKQMKTACKRFFANKSAFSLVELIVVIAIMAVMAAVLAPSLLDHVERSRAQKDDSAMNEVSSALHLSLADQNVYDKLLQFAVKDNYSCYCDGDITTNTYDNQISTKGNEYWLFNDNCRLLDETPYQPAGKMRGITVTFKPNGSAEYILKDGIVNQIGDNSTIKGVNTDKTLGDTSFESLYNRLRSTVGNTIKVSSQTYRNSDYTIFISLGTTGGNQADKQDAIQVYGQFNGTNLPEVTPASNISSSTQASMYNHNDESLHPKNLVPEGATYYVGVTSMILGDYTGATAIYQAGDEFPQSVTNGDVYVYGDYEYRYNYSHYNHDGGAWRNNARQEGWCPKVFSKTKTSYDAILESINGKPISSLYTTFMDCTLLTKTPEIPDGVKNMNHTFQRCESLKTASAMPKSLETMNQTFRDCKNLTAVPDLSKAVNVIDMHSAFNNCKLITTPPKVPNKVTDMQFTFKGCTALSGQIVINASPTTYDECLYGTQITEVLGSCPDNIKAAILATK